LIAINGLALLLPNIVVNGVTCLGDLVILLVLLDELETGSRVSQSQNQPNSSDL